MAHLQEATACPARDYPSDAFVLKLDVRAKPSWVVTYGGAQVDTAFALDVDAAHNVYVAGEYTGPTRFRLPTQAVIPFLSGNGTQEGYALKLSPAGLPLWKQAFLDPSSDAAMAITLDAIQLLGGYGYTKDFPVERMMRDAKITQIYEGTNQIQRMVMARALLNS